MRSLSESIIYKSGLSISKEPGLKTFQKRRRRMRKRVKILGVLLMIVMVSSFAAAVQKPALQQAGTTNQLVIDAQDVITASDAGGGALPSRDLIVLPAVCGVIF